MQLEYMAKVGVAMVKYDQQKSAFGSVQQVRFKFAILFTVALFGSGYLLWRSPMDYIEYKLGKQVFDMSIFIINTIVWCAICLIIPLQAYRKHAQTTMARSFAELIQMSLTRANRLGFCYVEYRGQREDGRFVNTEAVSLKFWLWIALILAGGWYTLGRTKEDMVVRYHKESLFDIGTYFVSNMIIVLLVLHMSWHGYFCRDVQLKLLNDVLDIERKLVMVFKRRCEYGNIERYLKIFTIWSIFFYVVLLNVLFVIDYWNYDDFIAMYVVALILLYSNFCMDLTIIVCCTVQMSLCLFLESLMDVLGSNSDEFAGLYTCVKQIDRIAVLVNYNMSRIYGPFVVLHCSYVLFDSASMWVSLLEATLNTNFDYVRQETHWMLANYLLWLANDVKNVILMAISSSLLHNKNANE
uniref:Gustatory receptor n=1 Tax=Anopheles dirus TaxID=7168 RepID=A0A182NBY4_9DIPT